MSDTPTRKPTSNGLKLDTSSIFPQGPLRTVYQPFRPLVEKALGFTALDALYMAGHRNSDSTETFCEAVLKHLEIENAVDEDALRELVSQPGPLVLAGNHPFGGPEALALCAALERVCPGRYKMMANQVLEHIPELQPVLITVDPLISGGSRNRVALKESLKHLKDGGVLAVFPAGRVSADSPEHGVVCDLPWKDQPLRLAEATGAKVAAFHVEGQAGRRFLAVPPTMPRLRALFLIREMTHPNTRQLKIRFGPAIPVRTVNRQGSPERAAERLRARCYLVGDLGVQRPVQSAASAEAEAAAQKAWEPIADRPDGASFTEDLERLRTEGKSLAEADSFEAVLFQGKEAPALLTELGRQREITFRLAGQGVGKGCDVSDEDLYYHHLVIWDRAENRLVGAYRIGFTDRILAEHGQEGLYLDHVFHIQPGFFEKTGPAMELSRSFVAPEYQRDGRALGMLWRGLGGIVMREERYSQLFGSVTISNAFSPASRAIQYEFLRQNHADDADIRALIAPRNPFAPITRYHRLIADAYRGEDISALKHLVDEAESGERAIPPLVRYYLMLGARFLAFHVEAAFNDALYCLLRVDLKRTDARHLKRFLGDEAPARFKTGAQISRPEERGECPPN